MANQAYKMLLELRYLGGNTWGEVYELMGYDLRWVYRLHGKALQVELRLINTPLRVLKYKLYKHKESPWNTGIYRVSNENIIKLI